jgi:alpha-galactosidase
MQFSAQNLPEGLTLKDNIITGSVLKAGNYEVTLIAKNSIAEVSKKVTFEIFPNNILVTPLLGFTSWNAFNRSVSQEKMSNIAKAMIKHGIAEYGYNYVNIDSAWQHKYGGEFDAILPNPKFPDMKAMVDEIHALGLKCGIYSTPMLTAWGCPDELASIPGCTQGEPDYRFSLLNGGIGTIRKEKNNALQWCDWGFDYLKYDWAPTDTVNADLMREELVKLERDFGFCVTVRAIKEYSNYWSKYCNSYRCNPDTYGNWKNLLEIYETYFDFENSVCKGHYFDLDMLDIGSCRLPTHWHALSQDEMIVEYSMRAFLSSPIQISSTLERVDDFELSLYCNEEIIAINQDCAFNTPTLVLREKENGRYLDVFEKKLEDGAYAYALFNLGEVSERVALTGEDDTVIYDLWAKEAVSNNGRLTLEMQPHTVRIFKSGVALKIQ